MSVYKVSAKNTNYFNRTDRLTKRNYLSKIGVQGRSWVQIPPSR